jgi:hypothetical protein
MTPSEIEEQARERYNAVGSSFWSQSEVFNLIYNAQMDFCLRTQLLERTFQTNTAIGTQSYPLPSTCMAVKSATWFGVRLTPINSNDDDLLTGFNEATTSSGDPRYFHVWNKDIILRPIPSSVQALKIWTFNIPQTVSAISVIDVAPEFQPWLIDYVVSCMVTKDENMIVAKYFMDLWEKNIINANKIRAKVKNSRGFNFVRGEETTSINFGAV